MLGPNDYAVIMAGGAGVRLWPLSRRNKPKQFQRILNGNSLLQTMYALLSQIFPPGHIFVQTAGEYAELVREQMDLDPEQIVIEPEARDTGPAFVFAAAYLAARNPQANLAILYADNLVYGESQASFFAALETGFRAIEAHPHELVVLGVRPRYPHTGLGYIEVGAEEPVPGAALPVFRTRSFVEKPELEVAKRLHASHSHLWNTGYKIVKVGHLLGLVAGLDATYARVLPDLVKALEGSRAEVVRDTFGLLPRQSFEYLVAEKARQLLAIAVDMEWSDVGDWDIIHRVIGDSHERGPNESGNVFQHDCEDTLLMSNHRPIVAIGVRGLVVIETEDAILVMPKARSQDLKPVLNAFLKKHPALE